MSTRPRCGTSAAVAAILAVGAVGATANAGPPENGLITALRVIDDISRPTGISSAPGQLDRLYIAQHTGLVRIHEIGSGTMEPAPFLDLTAQVATFGEAGLLDVAFDPLFETNGHFYVTYVQVGTVEWRVARFSVSADPDLADPASEVVLKTVPNTFSHAAGRLVFGPDGFLYVGVGDGSPPTPPDEFNRAQDPSLLWGKLLRLDVHDPPAYIAAGNPFIGDPTGADEIWAMGLRNPWRFSFDRLTGDLYIADVGRLDREEVDFVAAGSPGGMNFGWRCMEGTWCTGFGGCDCADATLVAPVVDIVRTSGVVSAVIGGFVYRGAAIPAFQGRYFYADYLHGTISSVRVEPDGQGGHHAVDPIDHTPLLNAAGSIERITTFGEDAAGELYIATNVGEVWKIMPGPDCDGNGVADITDIGSGATVDCNANGVPDACDIAQGAPDTDGDGVLDQCEFNGGDANGDGAVDIDDMIEVILQWGPCPVPPATCPADFDGSGVVDIDDAIAVVLNWTG